MKKIVAIILFVGFTYYARADHITGGEMFYSYRGIVNGQYQYDVTFKLFMRCNSGRQFSDPTFVSVFNKADNSRVSDISVPLSGQQIISYTNNNPCITNPPVVCYVVGLYQFTVLLPGSPSGYLLASQVNYRIIGINNLAPNYGLIGASYTAEIPGTSINATDAAKNTSAHFIGNDLVIICESNSFSYSFAAEDVDGDRLRYSFCSAYVSGGGGSPGNATPPSSPPYNSVPYAYPDFTGTAPLGNNVHINSSTGLITGVAPAAGKYVVTVCVEEIRNGVVIATQRKDLQINIASCSIAAATLYPQYNLCRDTKTIYLSNLSTSPLINTYNWQMINAQGATIFSSTSPSVTYSFPDTGIYIIKLFINQGQQCADSATSLARVYPGLLPGFNATGICINKPTQFTDGTTNIYGTISSWIWDFGDINNGIGSSSQQNPVYTYSSIGSKNIRLIVSNTKGCFDTLYKDITIVDKPPILLAFRDTLICVPDKVQLMASGEGNFSWSPAVNIINDHTPSPTVTPLVTTTYFADLDDNGCRNRDSVKVRVVDHVSLQTMADTLICQADPIQLKLISNGLHYAWTPVSQVVDPTVANPIVITNATTPYQVTAFIGSCFTKGRVLVSTVPYPAVNAGADTVICFNTTAQLHSTMDGNSFLWTPSSSLNNPSILNPLAHPGITTNYVLAVFDTKGCPKPGRDTVTVTVLPDIVPFAGRDTVVVVNQPLQLKASGGINYRWLPPDNLSSSNVADPIALFKAPSAGIQYKVLVYNAAGCADSTYVRIKVYKTMPLVFVPNAFTPNGDGRNDILRPIAVGIKWIEYFNIYNRWGHLVFSGANAESGWNGTMAGKPQNPDTYVWMVKAIDYMGTSYFQSGTVILIR